MIQRVSSAPPDDGRHESIEVDVRAWPRVLVTVYRSPSNEELHSFMNAWIDLVEDRDSPFVALIDVRRVDRFSAGQRKLVMSAIQHQSSSGRGYVGGVGLVLASDFMRALMNVMMMAVKTNYPVRAFEKVLEAEVWADGLIAARDSLRPPASR